MVFYMFFVRFREVCLAHLIGFFVSLEDLVPTDYIIELSEPV